MSAVPAIGNNLIWLLALSAVLAHTIIYLRLKYCGEIKALHVQDDMEDAVQIPTKTTYLLSIHFAWSYGKI